MMRKTMLGLALNLTVFLIMTAACQKKEIIPESEEKIITDFKGTITDPDGNIYRWQRMDDGRVWLLENMRFKVPDSWVYPESMYPSDIAYQPELYGRLYTKESAKDACAALGAGWQVPVTKDWYGLADAYGGRRFQSTTVTRATYENLRPGGYSGFDVLLGGFGGSLGYFQQLGINGYYWSGNSKVDYGDPFTDPGSRSCFLFTSAILGVRFCNPGNGQSCRCIHY